MKVKLFKILSQFGLHIRAQYRNLVIFQKKIQKYGDHKIKKTYFLTISQFLLANP
jgi:hypothetical protein